ncbi:MAG TPA: hypothetical protein PKE26_17025 [Kiritimatiellia bacterium]|nr:hypothetical protein [Saprospiraceae bacterium]HMP00802.1 hypothetical protein [Kiritimatiellia bacterium]
MEQKSVGIRIVPYAIGIICFILPFLQVSCSGEKLISFTGVQLVTGSEMSNPMTDESEDIPPNGYAVVALIAIILGLIFSLNPDKGKSIVAGIMGVISVASMILMKTKMDAEIMKEASGFPVTVDYKAGFWGLCIASAVGALLAFMRAKEMSGQQVARVDGSPAAGSPPSHP